MDSPSADIEQRDSFAIIRLNTEKGGAPSREMIVTLKQIFQNFENQPELRAIILMGAGDGAFSAEPDITESLEVSQSDAREDYRELRALCDQIEKCTVPLIAAIEGLAAGDGLALSLACHLRIASENASFSFTNMELEANAGHSAVQRLAREVGTDDSLDLSESRRAVLAEEALRFGLINRIVPDGRLLIEAEALARHISTMAPLAIRACLEAVNRGIELPLVEGLALEAQLFSSLFATDDVREGTSAFLQKRQPVFKGS